MDRSPPLCRGSVLLKLNIKVEQKWLRESRGAGEAPWGGPPGEVPHPGLQIMRTNTCQIHDGAHLAYKLCVKTRANCMMVPPWVTTNA